MFCEVTVSEIIMPPEMAQRDKMTKKGEKMVKERDREHEKLTAFSHVFICFPTVLVILHVFFSKHRHEVLKLEQKHNAYREFLKCILS